MSRQCRSFIIIIIIIIIISSVTALCVGRVSSSVMANVLFETVVCCYC